MLVSAMRPRSVFSFGYARTSRSGDRLALDSRMTANRTLENWSNALILSLVSPLVLWPKYAFCSCKPNSKCDSDVDRPLPGVTLLNQHVTRGNWQVAFGFVMKPVEYAHGNLEFPRFCHPSDGVLVKIVTLYCQWTNKLYAPFPQT